AAADQERYLRAVFEHPRWVDLDRGTVEEDDAVAECAARVGCAPAAMARLLHAARESLVPLPAGVALLEELAARGRALYCLTNMSRATFTQVRPKYDFWNRFKGIVVSAHVRMIKPDPQIFRHLLATHSIDAATSVFIDDHPPNVEAAREVGLTAVRFDGGPECLAAVRALAD